MNKPNNKTTLIKLIGLAVLNLIILFNVSFGQTKAEKLDELLSLYAEYGQFNGSVLVAEKGKVIYKKGFGLANMEWDIPNQSNTKFRLASVSKQFTAMVVMQLVANKNLSLEEPISTYLPDYPKANGDRITIHHLLTHSSGTPNFTSFQNYWEIMRNPMRPAEIVEMFADSALQFSPGERFDYSNSGYVLLGHIVEKVTGKSFEEVLQEQILNPLGMNNSGFDHNSMLMKNRAYGYNKRGSAYVNASYIDMSIPFTAGAMYSTVEDLFLWDQALYTEILLPQAYMEQIFEKHIPDNGSHYAYGWGISETNIGNSQELIQTHSHSGGINGFNTRITRIPADRSSIILLDNTSGAPLNHMTRAITGILYDKPYDLPLKSIARSLGEVINNKGLAEGLSYFKEVNGTSGHYLNENEMNLLGYEFLQINNLDVAESIFKLNVEAFPNAFNVYDSYGEILLLVDKKEEAIKNYKKSIQLNPDNQNAFKVLEGLGVETANILIKVPQKELRLIAGEYFAKEDYGNRTKEWKIVIEEVEGNLFGLDGNYRYRLIPQGNNKFVNPDDGATLEFNTDDKETISFVIFGKYTFNKVE